MDNIKNGKGLKVITLLTFLGMIITNALANILPINGTNTGQVSDLYPNLFAPAGITFAIWGLIYLLLGGYTLYHNGFFQGNRYNVKRNLLNDTGVLFSISSIANSLWIFAWHYHKIGLSMILMVIILICLILINRNIISYDLDRKEKMFIRLPFSVYFGWITVATIANATTLLVSLGWNGFGISEQIWAIIIIAVGTIIGITTMIRNRDIAYGLVLIWAYIGIYIKHSSATGFSGQYPGIIMTVIACIAIFLISLVYIIFSRRKYR